MASFGNVGAPRGREAVTAGVTDTGEYIGFAVDVSGNAATRMLALNTGTMSWESVTTDMLGGGGGMRIEDHDYCAVTYPTSTTDVYTFKTGGVAGTLVATITMTYSDATKESLVSVERS